MADMRGTSEIAETLNRELVVRLLLQTASSHLLSDRWALAHDIVRALDRWSSIPPEEIDERRTFLQVLESGQDY